MIRSACAAASNSAFESFGRIKGSKGRFGAEVSVLARPFGDQVCLYGDDGVDSSPPSDPLLESSLWSESG